MHKTKTELGTIEWESFFDGDIIFCVGVPKITETKQQIVDDLEDITETWGDCIGNKSKSYPQINTQDVRDVIKKPID